jgi:hypothetical protein
MRRLNLSQIARKGMIINEQTHLQEFKIKQNSIPKPALKVAQNFLELRRILKSSHQNF